MICKEWECESTATRFENEAAARKLSLRFVEAPSSPGGGRAVAVGTSASASGSLSGGGGNEAASAAAARPAARFAERRWRDVSGCSLVVEVGVAGSAASALAASCFAARGLCFEAFVEAVAAPGRRQPRLLLAPGGLAPGGLALHSGNTLSLKPPNSRRKPWERGKSAFTSLHRR